MTNRTAANRYARALFDVARAERVDLQRVERELEDFAQLLATNEALNRALTNPAVPAPKKRAAVQQLIARDAGFLPPVTKLLLMLAERDRLAILPDIVESYRSRLMDHLNVVCAEVVTAVPLLLFAAAARRLRFATLGFLQYLAPSIQFLLAVFAFGEHL